MTDKRAKGPFTGRHMATILIAFFGVVITVNIVMARFALSTFGGTVVEAVLGVVAEHGANLIAAGGYGAHPVVEAMLGSSVDQLRREAQVPVLICQ
mgnify:CR=1 FL=1